MGLKFELKIKGEDDPRRRDPSMAMAMSMSMSMSEAGLPTSITARLSPGYDHVTTSYDPVTTLLQLVCSVTSVVSCCCLYHLGWGSRANRATCKY